MIDANSQFFAILTNVGMAKQANADALGIPWKFSQMGVGDANGTDPIPNATQTRLINEWRRRPLNQVRIDPVNPAVIIAEQVIPADEGGKWIREIGLYDADGDLVAVANCAPSYKPVLSQGSGRTQVVRMNFIVASTGNITLKMDPAVVLATREYVDQRIMEELYKLDSKQSVRVATTANIALAGLLTIDGIALVAGDRVLVKNQTAAKDNGIYLAAASGWTRAPDADISPEVTSALLVSVEQGATLADTRWQLVTDGVIVLGTTALTFQNVTQGFAPINSPAFLGSPTAPLPAQFDSGLLLAPTAFVQRALGNMSGGRSINVSGAITLAASDAGQFISVAYGAAQAVTLPPLADVAVGTTIALHNPSGVEKTVFGAGNDKISPDGSQYGFVALRYGETAFFTKETGVWRLHGSSALRYSKALAGADWTTQPLFDNTKSFATTEYVMRALGNYRGFTSLTAATTLTSAAIGTVVTVIGTFTVTLPAANAVPWGSAINFRNIGGGVVTVVCAGADTINGGTINQLASIVLQPGATLELVSNGSAAWWASGSAQLQYGQVFGYTAPQFDNSKLFATAEFVQRAIGSYSAYTALAVSTAMTVAHVGNIVFPVAAGLTFTLPPAAGIRAGSSIKFFGNQAGVVIQPASGTIVQNGTARASITLGPNDTAELMLTTAAGWYVVGGSASLAASSIFEATTTPNGYQKSPGQMQECRGSFIASATPGAAVPVTFPLGFLAVHEVIITPANASTTTSSAWHDSASASGFNGRCNIPSALCHYVAKGTSL
ncbi:phage tail protein [Pseudomonas putida]|uniref:phage tail protein n=1 Tax=Pseudomonas putida TaxID=303 RepID=UPI001EF7E58E|nr:phage tail protein [Pseudomonas putida]